MHSSLRWGSKYRTESFNKQFKCYRNVFHEQLADY